MALANAIVTVLTKPRWSTREVQALRGVIRAERAAEHVLRASQPLPQPIEESGPK